MIEQESKTSKKSRVVTWIIAVLMIGGIITGFVAMIVGSDNSQKDAMAVEEAQARLAEIDADYTAKADVRDAELSKKYYKTLAEYKSQVKAYNAAAVTELKTEDLKVGDGAEITENTEYDAYYIGWLSDGTTFDSSFKDETSELLKSPISGADVFVQGWKTGIVGMKMGGVRLFTIPSDQAYGEVGSGTTIPPNSPLKFAVLAIPPVEKIAWPDDAVEACIAVYTGQIGDEQTTQTICQTSYGNE